jgi:hypothetical protein
MMQTDSGRRNRLVIITAYLLAIAFIFALPVSIIAHNGIRVLFSAEVLSESLSGFLLGRGSVREQLLEELFNSGWIEERVSGRKPFHFLNLQDRFRIAEEIFPDEWIMVQIEEGFATSMEWLQTDDPAPKIYLDFKPVKQGLLAGGSKAIAEILMNSWPSCSREQELVMRRALHSDAPLNFEFCKPGEDLHIELVDQLDFALQEHVRNIKSEILIFDAIGDSIYRDDLSNTKTGLLRLSLWLRRLRLSPLPILGLIMALVIRSFYDLGRWWGIPLLVGSLLGLLLIAVWQGTLPNMITLLLPDSGEVDSVRSVIFAIFERITEGSSAQLFLTFIIGAGLFGITWAFYRRQTEPKSRSVPRVADKLPEKREDFSPSDIPQERGIPSPPPVKPFDPEDLSEDDNDKPTGVFD